jgi:hypothetical protein
VGAGTAQRDAAEGSSQKKEKWEGAEPQSVKGVPSAPTCTS